MSTKLDLSQLALDRGQQTSTVRKMNPRWMSRYLLPAGLVLAFASLLAWATKDSLLPSQDVTIVPVVVAKAKIQKTGAPLFQAAGWVEPRPASIVISALAPGVIENIFVVEGEEVKKGQIIARLIDIDAMNRLREAEATRQLRQAMVDAAVSELESAKLMLENPLTLEAEVADAQSTLAQVESQLQAIPSNLAAAKKRHDLAIQNVSSRQQAGAAIPGRLLRDSKGEQAAAQAQVELLTTQKPLLEQRRDVLRQRVDVLTKQLKLRLGENRRFKTAKAEVLAAKARLTQSEVALDNAKLELQRTIITAPITGRVLSRQADPGMRVVGIDPHSEKGASAVVTLYDPKQLQIRVDVRLEDLPNIVKSQRALIETASVPGGLKGEVVAITSVADIQKNTLQVKVAVDNPPDLLRPEMLSQVTFLAPAQDDQDKEEMNRLRVMIPRTLVEGEGSQARVWVANLTTKSAEYRAITLGKAGTKELIEVLTGLNPTDKLIYQGRESLVDSTCINVVSEDNTVGINHQSQTPSE